LQAFNVTQDKQAPKLVLDQTSGLVTNQSPTITGDVFDNLSGVASLQVKARQRRIGHVTFDQQGRFSVPANLATDGSADGRHTLTFVATDSAGNAATPLVFSFTLDTKAPAITLASTSIQDGGTLVPAGTNLTGTADPTGSSLTALTYRFDSGTIVPVSFNAKTGAFDQAPDFSSLGIGAHTLTLTARDGAGNTTVTNAQCDAAQSRALDGGEPYTGRRRYRCRRHLSAEGDLLASVNAATLTSDSFLCDRLSARKSAPRSSHRTTAPLPRCSLPIPLPGASTITVHVIGSKIAAPPMACSSMRQALERRERILATAIRPSARRRCPTLQSPAASSIPDPISSP